MMRQKIELSDLSGYDWDWSAKYEADVVAEILKSFSATLTAEFPGMPAQEVQRLAAQYAQERGARLLRLDGDLNVVRLTQERVNALVSGTIERGDSLQKLQKALREDFAFSKQRARLVARTETANALGQGQKQAAIAQDRNEKHWVTQGDDLVRFEHVENENAGWIGIGDIFPSGEDTISLPNCRCVVRYRTVDASEIVASFRCPICNKLLGKDLPMGTPRWCSRCKVDFKAGDRRPPME